MSIDPLPAPGIAIFPQFLSQSPPDKIQHLTMRGASFSSTWTVTSNTTSQPLLTITSDNFSLSHRKHITDASTNQPLCEITKESFRSRYTATAPNGTVLFTTEAHSHFSGTETQLHFTDYAGGDGGRQETLVYKKEPFSRVGDVRCQGRLVGSIDRKGTLRSYYDLGVCPGVDLFLIVALAVVVDDRQKRKKAGAAGGAAGGASAGGGC